jgi:hypothetical protein
VLSAGIAAAGRWIEPDAHPLAAHVHRHSLTNLITWPFTGVLPPQLAEFTPKVPRRGPVGRHPNVSADAKNRVYDLLAIAERDTQPQAALLRRQAVYLLGFDRRPHVTDWPTSDDFMAHDHPGHWAGVRLLRHLIARLDPALPHLPLNLHTVHALVASRPVLLIGWPGLRASLAEALDRIASSDALTRTGRDQVAGLRYALRIATR